jgi:FAD/FMN-containing dehydrogenase/Fe-S oxidoreductase
MEVMMGLEIDLKKSIRGDVHFDKLSRKIYSVDASIYEIEPLGIVLPRSPEDLRKTIELAHKYEVPVIARGAATGITGACLGRGLIIDTSKYLNKILEINYEKEFAICEPGVIQDQLNEALAERGYRLGPDTSTGNRATLGGMVANNSAGARSLLYGKMVDHIEGTHLILANGEEIYFDSCDEKKWRKKLTLGSREGDIYRVVDEIRTEYRDEISLRFPKIPRRVSGYNLDELIKPGPLNLAKLIVGSEGTLGIISKIKVRISPRPRYTGISVIHFNDQIKAMHAVLEMLKFHPIAIEMIDHHIISMGRLSPTMHTRLGWLSGSPDAVFAAEFAADTPEELKEKLKQFTSVMKNKEIGYAHVNLTQKEEIDNVWAIRKAGLELLLSKRTYSRAIAFVEDISVAPEKLASFMEAFIKYLKSIGKDAGIYGHVGSGCMHIRPYIDLRDPQDLKLMSQIMQHTANLLLEHEGALSGEHGDGIVRSWLNRKMFGDRIYKAFLKLKRAFDPENLMNPGKKVEGHDFLEDLRMNPSVKQTSISTFLDFSTEGGFELAVDLCNGNGLCRKKDNVMCPSFQVSGDEYDSTRARAQSLRSIINGRMPLESLTSPELLDVLDLCIECKGCKRECPSHVDMAKMKAEVLFQHQEKHGYSVRNRLFAHIGDFYDWMSPIAPLANHLMNNPLSKYLLGIAPERSLPLIAKEKFSEWFATYEQPKGLNDQVILFNDTYNEFQSPEIGKAAVQVLNRLGYYVITPPWKCCGRPMISKGLLKQARTKAEAIVDLLIPYAKEKIPIVGLEPSCILTFRDEFIGLLGSKNSQAQILASRSQTIDEFLNALLNTNKWPKDFKNEKKHLKLHGHCHQKALVTTKPSLNVLRELPGLTVSEIPSGCCGMAGSFGYEKEHYEFSMQIGELKLFPAVRDSSPETIIVADGVSCRSQIAQGTDHKPLHLIQVVHSFFN